MKRALRTQTSISATLLAFASIVGCQSPTPRFISNDVGTRFSDYAESQSADLQQSIELASFDESPTNEGDSNTVSHLSDGEPILFVPSREISEPESGRRDASDRIDGLTLDDLEAIAFQNNPTLMVAAARASSAQGQAVQAGLYPNPVIGYHATEIGNRDTAGQQGAFVSQRIIMGGKRNLDRAIAAREADAVHYDFHAQELRVLSDVRMRFYESLIAQKRVELATELTVIGDRLVEATDRLLAGGQASANDRLQATIRAQESYILRDNAINEYEESWRRLAYILGTPNLEMSPLVGELESHVEKLEWGEALSNVMSSHPSLAAARTRVDVARLSLQRAFREPIPNIDLSVSHRHHNVTQDEVTNVQVGLPIPVFDRNQGNIQSRQAEYSMAIDEVSRLELEIQDQMAKTFRRYENARQQMARYQETVVPAARDSLQLVTEGYEQGQVEYLNLLNAQQTYVQVNLSYLGAISALREAKAAIEGHLLVDSLLNRP